MNYQVIALSAGLSVPSSTRMLVDRLLEATSAAGQAVGLSIDTEVIEIREIALDTARVMVTGMPEPRVEAALDALEAADALIAVSPIYAGSYAGVFKSFMDLVGTERLAGTPVVLGATGGSSRHNLAIDHAMRPLFSAMRAHTLPTGVFAATDDFGAASAAPNARVEGGGLQSRVERAAAEVVAALAAASLPTALSRRHQWTSPSEAAAQTARLGGEKMAMAGGMGLAPGKLSHQAAQEQVGEPGPGSAATLLKSDGTKGRLRPDMDDFVPMTQIFGG